jgi:nitroimidazol reductase NimA-like FMN-containing flavoprotein (pyridoxamine 5'-phosphate oxidase superfamily)
MAAAYEPTERTRVRRRRDRGRYEAELIHGILDQALVCHLGFVAGGEPYVIPTIHARDGEVIYLHGSPANRMLGELADGARCCLTATLVDELVLARSARKHSLNYRSAMVFGTARVITDEDEKRAALRAVVEHVAPGRSEDVRKPDENELKGTSVLGLPIEEASAKVREGPPADDPGDLESRHWAGLLPLRVTPLAPVPAPDLRPDLPVPDHILRWHSGGA